MAEIKHARKLPVVLACVSLIVVGLTAQPVADANAKSKRSRATTRIKVKLPSVGKVAFVHVRLTKRKRKRRRARRSTGVELAKRRSKRIGLRLRHRSKLPKSVSVAARLAAVNKRRTRYVATFAIINRANSSTSAASARDRAVASVGDVYFDAQLGVYFDESGINNEYEDDDTFLRWRDKILNQQKGPSKVCGEKSDLSRSQRNRIARMLYISIDRKTGQAVLESTTDAFCGEPLDSTGINGLANSLGFDFTDAGALPGAPGGAFGCSPSATAVPPNEFSYGFSCNQQITGFGIQTPGRMIVGVLDPTGASCTTMDLGGPMDYLWCNGVVPAGTQVNGNIRTFPPAGAGTSVNLFANDGATQQGPFSFSVP